MKKLDEAIENIKYGSVLTINKDKINHQVYNSCIVVYDGRIFVDVKIINLKRYRKKTILS